MIDAVPSAPRGGGPAPDCGVAGPTSLYENRVLVLAPVANDGPMTAAFIRRAGMAVHVCRDITELAHCIAGGCGAIVLAEEVLHPGATNELMEALRMQQSWSDIPVSLVCSAGDRNRGLLHHLKMLGPTATVALIERPFRPETLISMLEAALRSRQRQYQVRDLVAELGANEARIRRILEQAVVGIAETSLDFRFTLVNDRFCAMLGRPREELVRFNLLELTHPDDRAETARGLAGLMDGHLKSVIAEKRYVGPDGSEVWVQDHVSPVRDPSGRIFGLTVASADISARKLSEKQLAHARDEALAASRAKDDFLASLSHELRTPLNPVLLLASEAARNDDLPPAVQADFETISRNVALEARLIDDLLDLTRITRGKLHLDRATHSLHRIIDDAIATVDFEFADKRIALHRRLADVNPLVHGDAVRLQQVFWNLLKNAVKFTPVGGEVTISSAVVDEGGAVVVMVTDTGIGLLADEADRIFEAFVQGEHASRRAHSFGGLGLGLAISRTLIELHRGRISATSAGPGKGSSFSVELPVAGLAESPGFTPRPMHGRAFAPGDVGPRRILLVEDHEPTRTALAALLRRRQFEVISTGSIAEAERAVADSGIDLVISDIGLPDGSGYDLMRTLAQTAHVKGIALTGYGMEHDIYQSEQAGFAAHLVKPVRIDALDDALRALLALR